MTDLCQQYALTVISEERPKEETIKFLLHKAVSSNRIACQALKRQIAVALAAHESKHHSLRLHTTQQLDTFILCGEGLALTVRIVAGEGSFPDYLLYEHPTGTQPSPDQPPVLALEETKNTGDDARNMVWQRLSKLVSLRLRFPNEKVPFFLYLEKSPFGTHAPLSVKNAVRMLRTLGGELGYRENIAEPAGVGPFESVQEMADALNSTEARSNNTTLRLCFTADGRPTLTIRLQKGQGKNLSDPNTGVLTSIALALRTFGYATLLVKAHRLWADYFDAPRADKLAKVAVALDIAFDCDGAEKRLRPRLDSAKPFWATCNQEKLASIRVHMLVLERGTAACGLTPIFSNHGGCEKEFYLDFGGEQRELKKAEGLPDLLLADDQRGVLYILEAKLASEVKKGLTSLEGEKQFLEDELPRIDPRRSEYERAYGLLVYSKTSRLPAEPDQSSSDITLTEFIVFESATEHWIKLSRQLALALGVNPATGARG